MTSYSARFMFRNMDLTPDAVILHPLWFTFGRHVVRITETVTAAYTRPRLVLHYFHRDTGDDARGSNADQTAQPGE